MGTMVLPVAAEAAGLRCGQHGAQHGHRPGLVVHAAVGLPPGCVRGVVEEVGAGDVVVGSDLEATQPGEEALHLVGVYVSIGVALVVIDLLDLV